MSFHLYKINELYSNADGTIQFIELRVAGVNGESFWRGQTLSVSQVGTTHRYTFPTDLPSAATANTTVLVATQGFADLGLVPPNFIIPSGFLFTDGGTVDFAGADQLDYNGLPADGLQSINRSLVPGVNSPTNFAGQTGSIAATTNHAPALGAPVTDASVVQHVALDLAMPANQFADAGDRLTLHATRSDGSPLPAWLHFDPASATFSGTPGAGDAGTLNLSVMATDRQAATAQDDFVLTVVASNLVGGTAGNDTLNGTAGIDVLVGQAGNDRLVGGPGNDVLDGGAGLDMAVFQGARTDWTIDRAAGLVSGPEGRDTFAGVERLRFGDMAVALDLEAGAGATARLLGAVFGAAAVHNRVYAGIGIDLFDRGSSPATVADLAIHAALGANPGSEALVRLLYTNVVGSAPDDATTASYVDLISSGQFTQVSLTTFAADISLNATRIDLAGLAQTGLEYLPVTG